MASEIRKIGFNLSEIYAAVQAYAARMNKKIPTEKMASIKEDVGGRLCLSFGEYGDTKIHLTDAEMIMALLVFCQEKKVPVPKDGKKTLRLDGSILTLIVQFPAKGF